MNDTEKKLIYRLSRKGRENYDAWDRLLIAANPAIKRELEKLEQISPETYRADRRERERKTAELEREAARKGGHLLSLTLPTATAACFLLVFGLFFIRQGVWNQQTLGGSVRLFVHSATEPEKSYKRGDSFKEGDKLRLSFLPEGEVSRSDKSQGLLFSIDSNLESAVYYRHAAGRARLSETRVTEVKEIVHLTPGVDYIYLFIIFSEEEFSEEELIEGAKEAVGANGLQADHLNKGEFKDKVWDYIYLKRGE